jgi:hypothetical protein
VVYTAGSPGSANSHRCGAVVSGQLRLDTEPERKS